LTYTTTNNNNIYQLINNIHSSLAIMKVEIELYIKEEDETVVMEKVSSLTKQAKQEGFKIDEIELKGSKHNNNNNNNMNQDKQKNKSSK
jgi:hypothetical protein